MIAHYGDEILQHHDLAHACNRLRCLLIHMSYLATQHGTVRERCELHSWRQRIDPLYFAAPLVFSTVSSRFNGRPIKRNAAGSFRGTSLGAVTAAARLTSRA